MMWSWHGVSGWDWVWMSFMMVAFWGLIGLGIYALVRTTRHEHPSVDPKQVLAERFARGEISRLQYEEDRKRLAS